MERRFVLEAEAIRRESALEAAKAREKADNDRRLTDAKIESMEKLAAAKAKEKKKVKLTRTAGGYEASEE
jgi:hypothetical protein